MHPDNNARSGDQLPEISTSSDNAQLTNILRRLVAVLLALGNTTRTGNITMNPIKFSNALLGGGPIYRMGAILRAPVNCCWPDSNTNHKM